MSVGREVLGVAAAGEAVTGLALIGDPSLVSRLLLGAELSGVGIATGRVAGFALLALGLACWPGAPTGSSASRPLGAMLTYSLLATLYLGYLGVGSVWVGTLLWPAVVAHAVLTVLLTRTWLKEWRGRERNA